MKSLHREGVRLCYEERGAGKPALVFVHGWCCHHGYFAPQVEHFAARHRVLAYDQRGFGSSDQPEQAYTIEGFADDLAWLCGELGVERPVLVGHSLGGAVALCTAARHPDLPLAIALCDPAIFVPKAAAGIHHDLIEGLGTGAYRRVARDFIEKFLFIESDDPERKARIVDEMTATPQRVMRSAFENLVAFDEEAAARACRVPVLNIDAAVPIVESERFRGLCPQLESAQTPGTGHFHQLEAPDEVNALLERFLRGLGSA